MLVDKDRLSAAISTAPPSLSLNKIGHVVLMVKDVERSTAFYTGVLGFRVSDVYPETMMKGRMVFMRCASDHHGVALVGQGPGPSPQHEMHHMAFEVGTLDEVFEVLTLCQTGKSTKSRIILFDSHYWNGIINFDGLVQNGMITEQDRDLLVTVETAEEVAALRERDAVAVDGPQQSAQREGHEDLHQDREHVLAADQPAVEKEEPRDAHHQDQGGADEDPGVVAGGGSGDGRNEHHAF